MKVLTCTKCGIATLNLIADGLERGVCATCHAGRGLMLPAPKPMLMLPASIPPRLEIQPITQTEAFTYIDTHHRHHRAPAGSIFQIGINDNGRLCGVIVVGRPVSRVLDSDDYCVEVTRCCTDGTKNAASMLYAAAQRAARAMGYRRVVTYTLKSEPGTSLKAAGWTALYTTPGKTWNVPTRPRVDKHPLGQKVLWEAI